MATAVVRKHKQNVTLTIEPELAREAKAAGFSLSQILADAVAKKLKETAAANWKRENAEAIADLNAHMSRNGLFSDAHRKF